MSDKYSQPQQPVLQSIRQECPGALNDAKLRPIIVVIHFRGLWRYVKVSSEKLTILCAQTNILVLGTTNAHEPVHASICTLALTAPTLSDSSVNPSTVSLSHIRYAKENSSLCFKFEPGDKGRRVDSTFSGKLLSVIWGFKFFRDITDFQRQE